MMDTKVMHNRQLVDEIARQSGPWCLTRQQVRKALCGILDVITAQMTEGSAITIAGFGRFEAKEHKGCDCFQRATNRRPGWACHRLEACMVNIEQYW